MNAAESQILIIDDDPAQSSILKQPLLDQRHEAVTVEHNPGRGIEHYYQELFSEPPFDLVLLDNEMPGECTAAFPSGCWLDQESVGFMNT